MLTRKWTKESGSQAPAPEENRKGKLKGDHLWNSCGSEAGQDERKPSAEPSTRTWKEGMRNQAGEKGETEEARAETGTGKATVRRSREEKEKKKQRLSSQNPKLRRTKECRNSGGQKVERKR